MAKQWRYPDPDDPPEAIMALVWDLLDELPEELKDPYMAVLDGLIGLWLDRGLDRGQSELENELGIKVKTASSVASESCRRPSEKGSAMPPAGCRTSGSSSNAALATQLRSSAPAEGPRTGLI